MNSIICIKLWAVSTVCVSQYLQYQQYNSIDSDNSINSSNCITVSTVSVNVSTNIYNTYVSLHMTVSSLLHTTIYSDHWSVSVTLSCTPLALTWLHSGTWSYTERTVELFLCFDTGTQQVAWRKNSVLKKNLLLCFCLVMHCAPVCCLSQCSLLKRKYVHLCCRLWQIRVASHISW